MISRHSVLRYRIRGNNVVAFVDDQLQTTKQSGKGLIFNYTYDVSDDPQHASNVDAARTNAFYLANTVHDIAYRYGFTESAFNFQNNNFDKGGKGNDRVLMMVQNSEGYDDARFITPPE